MNLKILFGLLISILLLTGCITEYNAILPENDKKILFVDGSIMENTDLTFRVSQSFSLAVNTSDKIPEESYINDASVYIIGSNGYKSPPAINQGKGAYRISTGELDNDVEYGIQIEYDGDIYQSIPSKPLYTAEIDSISWVQPEFYGPVYFYISTYDETKGAKYFMWDYTEDWEILAPLKTTIFFHPMSLEFTIIEPAPLYYCWKQNKSDRSVFGSTESLSENRIINKQFYQYNEPSNDRFSALYSITVTQRAISKGAYEYHQNIKKMNEEMGGLFTPQPTEFAGNISCITNPSKKILGYIDVSKNTTQKRIFIHPYQIVREWPDMCRNSLIIPPLQWDTYAHWYQRGLRPAGDADMKYYPDEILPYEWYPAQCTDCTAGGGSKDKPDFWPNDHR